MRASSIAARKHGAHDVVITRDVFVVDDTMETPADSSPPEPEFLCCVPGAQPCSGRAGAANSKLCRPDFAQSVPPARPWSGMLQRQRDAASPVSASGCSCCCVCAEPSGVHGLALLTYPGLALRSFVHRPTTALPHAPANTSYSSPWVEHTVAHTQINVARPSSSGYSTSPHVCQAWDTAFIRKCAFSDKRHHR